jgi:molybdate transport system substrate-binding protein
MKPLAFLAALVIAWALIAAPAVARRVTVAVAANFLTTAEALAQGFEAETGDEVALVHGSTGKLYAQVVAGAPFDVFLSADADRPARLMTGGRALDTMPYALGRLVLVLRDAGNAGPLDDVLARTDLRLAIADPAVAPYGLAAREVLERVRGEGWRADLVFGESVGQAFAFIATGNVDGGLVAFSQTQDSAVALTQIEVPGDLHAPIRQDAVLLARAGGNATALAFFEYLGSPAARAIIADAGYGVP